MKIGYFGDGPWAHLALEKIIETPHLEIAYIVARFDTADPILRRYSEKLEVPFLLHANVNDQEFIDNIKKYSPDINVSMSFNQILKKRIINSAPFGFINCHAGALPFYRGRNILNWALINGEKEFGVTVHYINEGIDTGDIILQNKAEISENDDYASVLDKAIELCASTLHEALLMIKENKITPIKQTSIHPTGFYCSRRISGDEYIDWNWTSANIYNFVRAITTPGPGARTFLNEKEITIWKTEKIKDAPSYICKQGEIIGKDDKGIIVKTGDSFIRITEVSECSNEHFVPNYPIGTRFTISKLLFDFEKLKRYIEL